MVSINDDKNLVTVQILKFLFENGGFNLTISLLKVKDGYSEYYSRINNLTSVGLTNFFNNCKSTLFFINMIRTFFSVCHPFYDSKNN